ncbi:universal stress protein [Nonomuraea sp. NPDC059194]|uniref:universal stress protein n=1 Tax=Nonomuraea sp. NPDC059194 TaxID=3346764 RepID=UPI0036AD2D6D
MIIAGFDGSAAARAAVEWAADDALRLAMPLRIVHAVDRWPYQNATFPPQEWPDTMIRAGEKLLAEAEAVARTREPAVTVDTRLVQGAPAAVLLEAAGEAAEIVVGSRGLGGFAGALIGSVSMHVADQAACPVIVIRGEQGPVRGEIVVGVDDASDCGPALAYAFEQAALRGSTLRAIHAWQLPTPMYSPALARDLDDLRASQLQLVTEAIAVYRDKHPDVRVIKDVRQVHPVEALTEASAQADLVVVGSHSRNALERVLLGSVSRGVLHHAHCPVAVVRTA